MVTVFKKGDKVKGKTSSIRNQTGVILRVDSTHKMKKMDIKLDNGVTNSQFVRAVDRVSDSMVRTCNISFIQRITDPIDNSSHDEDLNSTSSFEEIYELNEIEQR